MSSRRVWELGDGHVVVVASREELAAPGAVALPPPEPAPGLLLPDGSINWGCPCLGGMATGPCGTQFRDAFSCFHYSEADPKGSDCYEKFSVMQECMAQYPTLYGKDDDDDDELSAALQEAADGTRDDGDRDDGPRDDGPRDDGPRDDGPRDDGPRDDGPRDDGPRDDGPRDDVQRDDVQRAVVAPSE